MGGSILNTISLFSGVGMLDEGVHAGLEFLGVRSRTVLFAEREAYPVSVLAARMEDGSIPPAPIWFGDLCELNAGKFRGVVDCVIGGFPCQDLSLAGKRAGLDGKRSGLFFELLRIAEDSGARYLFLENVSGIASATASVVDETEGPLDERAASRVVGELADRGWNAEWLTLSASDVGASHGRARWFCWAWRELADTQRDGPQHDEPAENRRRPSTANECGGHVDDPQRAERRSLGVCGTGGEQGHDGRRREADGGPGVADEVLGHAGLQHQHLQQREDGAEHPGTSGLMECEFCGYEFPECCGRYGCPNCECDGLANPARLGRHQGRAESGGIEGRPDAAECAMAHAERSCDERRGIACDMARTGCAAERETRERERCGPAVDGSRCAVADSEDNGHQSGARCGVDWDGLLPTEPCTEVRNSCWTSQPVGCGPAVANTSSPRQQGRELGTTRTGHRGGGASTWTN